MTQNPPLTSAVAVARPDRVMNMINRISSDRQVLGLLWSPQFEVIYQEPYRGTDEEVHNIVNLCDGLVRQLSSAQVSDRLALAVGVIDACLIDNLPAQEVRTLIKTIVQKDVSLLNHMPCTKTILARVLRAIVLSKLLAQVRRITQDVRKYQQQFGGEAE